MGRAAAAAWLLAADISQPFSLADLLTHVTLWHPVVRQAALLKN